MKRTAAIALMTVLLASCTSSVTVPDVEVEALGAHGAGTATFTAHLSGDQEVPPADTSARGQAVFRLSADGMELHYRLIVANIENVTQAHIHLGPAGVNGPVVAWLYPDGPPAQLIPGRTSGVLATGIITADDLVGLLAGEPLAALVEVLRLEGAYVNVHTSQFPPGEVRGQIR